jgi:hypothetical protein
MTIIDASSTPPAIYTGVTTESVFAYIKSFFFQTIFAISKRFDQSLSLSSL